MRSLLRLASHVLLVLTSVSSAEPIRATDEGPLQRWAILASPAVQQDGLPDLLTAVLSAQPGLTLVERDQLALATRELEWSTFQGSPAAGQRLNLGQLLKADALVVLSREEREQAPFVKLVISDCLYGARLRFEYFPFRRERLDELSRECAAAVQTTRTQFAGGIRHLIAVSPFLSKNLTHDYDHLQTGYAALLSSALSGFPGLAVVEIEEARAIGRELELSGDALRGRVVPCFVEGEYEMATAPPGEEPAVRLHVRLTDGKQVRREDRHPSLSARDVRAWLTETAPRKILESADPAAIRPIGQAQQLRLLVSRADMFSQVGAWPEAAALREAALVLDPRDAEQRLQLIADYRQGQYAAPPVHFRPQGQPPTPPDQWRQQLQASCQQQEARFHVFATHVDALLRQRAVNPREAGMLTDFLAQDVSRFLLPYVTEAGEIRETLYRFFWTVFPHVGQLDYGLRDGAVHAAIVRAGTTVSRRDLRGYRAAPRQRQFELWTWAALHFLFSAAPPETRWDAQRGEFVRRAGTGEDRRTLQEISRFLAEVHPDDYLVDALIETIIQNESTGFVCLLDHARRGRFGWDDLRACYERLRQSPHPDSQFYGRCGLLALRTFGPGVQKLDADAVREAEALRTQYAQRNRHLTPTASSAVTLDRFRRLQDDVVRRAGLPLAKKHRLTPNPIPDFNPRRRVSFLPVGDVRPQWTALQCGGPSLDLMWSDSAVFAMPQAGVVRRIITSSQLGEPIEAVQYDGAQVWIGLKSAGLRVVSLDGRILGTVRSGAELPQYDRSIVAGVFANTYTHPLILHPIGPGRCLALGRFGDQGRLWIALVSLDATSGQGRPAAPATVKIIHQATKTGNDDALDTIFDPAWVTEYADPAAPGRRLLLVGRRELSGSQRQARHPLAMDLTTFAVSTFPAALPASTIGHSLSEVTCVGGRFLWAGGRQIDVIAPAADASGQTWRRSSLVTVDPYGPVFLPGELLRQGEAFYSAGAHWYRIDQRSLAVAQLTASRLPCQHVYQCYGVSAHYGLVAWNVGDRVYQVQTHDEPVEDTDPDVLYPHVPAARRDKHRQAVEAIRRLGGQVDAVWALDAGRISSFLTTARGFRDVPEWSTFVYLSNRWQGGDAGLALLADLDALRALYLVQTNVSDRGLESLPQLDALQVLHLVETKATDGGLTCLARLPHLTQLRLEGTTGGREFGDAGLKHLELVPELTQLEIYGAGFTDGGLELLGKAPKLQRLTVMDTAITPTSLEKLKSTKPGFYWSIPIRP